jgi:hypothetical protein
MEEKIEVENSQLRVTDIIEGGVWISYSISVNNVIDIKDLNEKELHSHLEKATKEFFNRKK